MKILLINHYAGSPEMGMEFRPYYMAQEWIRQGHEVDIIAADYSHLRRKNPKVQRDWQIEEIDGIRYHWLRTGDYDGNGVRRALTMFRFVGKIWLKAKVIAREWKPDVVITSSTYPLDTYAGQRIRKYCLKNIKLIHEVHDMWPATLYEVGGMSKRHPFVVLMQFAENSAYQHSDRVVSLLPHAKSYMIAHGMDAEKYVCIPNGVVVSEWENPAPLPEIHKNFFEEHKGQFIVGYFGGHALSNALDILLDVAKRINDSQISFLLVGDGVEKKNLLKRKEEEKLDQVHFLPAVSKASIPELLKSIDCIYIGGANSPLYQFGLCPNKLFDSMMAGKPIIFAFTAPETAVEQYNCGLGINSGDTEGIVHSIKDIKELSLEQRSVLGANGKKAVLEHFTYKKLAKNFEALF